MHSFSDLEPVCSNRCLLTCIQISQEAVRWSGVPISFRIFRFVVTQSQALGESIKPKQTFFRNSLAFLMIQQMSAIWSLVPLPFLNPDVSIWKFTVHVLLKPGLANFEHYFASVWDECNCVVVWTFFGIVFLWDWSKNWPFPVLWPLLGFPNVLTYWVECFDRIIF